mmetsp:Transcript_13418/g.29551  ORF Transcript_13418/g.29551 Transcript_13418/m.29551 type:complete len:108 (-) Transcript_13418:2233-2556(-)
MCLGRSLDTQDTQVQEATQVFQVQLMHQYTVTSMGPRMKDQVLEREEVLEVQKVHTVLTVSAALRRVMVQELKISSWTKTTLNTLRLLEKQVDPVRFRKLTLRLAFQ